MHSLFQLQHQRQGTVASYFREVINTSPLELLNIIYDLVYKNKSEEMVKDQLTVAALQLSPDSLSKACWDKIHEGFTKGRGESFLAKLKYYGVYSKLFPPVFEQMSIPQQYNDDWLEARLKLVDTRHKENNTFYNKASDKLAAVLLIVKELPANWTRDDLLKVHAAYHIPFECDEAFEKHVHYVNGRKQKYFSNLNKIMNVLNVINGTVYHNQFFMQAESEAISDEINCLIYPWCTEKHWKLICHGFTNGAGEQFFDELRKFQVYSILFPTVFDLSDEQQQRNDEWLAGCLKTLDNAYPDKAWLAYDNITAILLVAKELPTNWSQQDLQKVHAAYQIPVPCDVKFVKGLQEIMKNKIEFLNNKMELEKTSTHAFR